MSSTGWIFRPSFDSESINRVSKAFSTENGLSWSIAFLATLGLLKIVQKWININDTAKKTAPYVKYWVPWLGSVFSLGKDPDGFFRQARSELGPVFKVKTFGQDLVYVTSPELINTVYRDPKTFTFVPIRLDMAARIFGMTRDVLNSSAMQEDYFKLHHRELSPLKIPEIHRRYGKYVYGRISKTLEKSNDEDIIPWAEFIKPIAYDAASYAFFGPNFDSKASYEPFKKFDNVFHFLGSGLPLRFLPEAHKARNFVVTLFEKYLSLPCEDSSDLVKNIQALAEEHQWSLNNTAKTFFSDFWALQSNAVNAAYWIIVLQLERPEGLQPLIDEVDMARKNWKDSHQDTTDDAIGFEWALNNPLPLITSTVMETLRVSTSTISIRMVEQDTILGGYHIRKGEKVTCATREVHMDASIHPNPTAFLPDRYIDGRSKFIKDGRPVPNHTMPFGGGISICEGRHFALGELKILTALLLAYVTIRIDPASKWPKYLTSRVGTGLMPPDGDLFVKVSRRQI